MTNLVIKTSTALFLLATLGQSAASAAPTNVTGSAALAVAAVVAQHSPLLSADEKKLIAGGLAHLKAIERDRGIKSAHAASKKRGKMRRPPLGTRSKDHP